MEDNFGYLIAAFGIGWALFMGLAYWNYRRIIRLRHEVDELKQARNPGPEE
jgi:hypothetical protein